MLGHASDDEPHNAMFRSVVKTTGLKLLRCGMRFFGGGKSQMGEGVRRLRATGHGGSRDDLCDNVLLGSDDGGELAKGFAEPFKSRVATSCDDNELGVAEKRVEFAVTCNAICGGMLKKVWLIFPDGSGAIADKCSLHRMFVGEVKLDEPVYVIGLHAFLTQGKVFEDVVLGVTRDVRQPSYEVCRECRSSVL